MPFFFPIDYQLQDYLEQMPSWALNPTTARPYAEDFDLSQGEKKGKEVIFSPITSPSISPR
jgi:hypothetical protein